MSKYHKSRSTHPARSYRSSAEKSAGRYSGVKWIIIGILIGVMLAIWLNWKYTKSLNANARHQNEMLSSHPVVPSKISTTVTKPAVASETAASPQFDFYTMLPKMQVAATNNQPQPASSPAFSPSSAAALPSSGASDDSMVTASAQTEASVMSNHLTADASVKQAASPPESTVEENASVVSVPSVAELANIQYWLQVGVVQQYEAVDQLKAQLAMLGLDVTVEKFKINSQTYYRVSVGPYTSRQRALAKQKQLKGSGLASMIVKKPA